MGFGAVWGDFSPIVSFCPSGECGVEGEWVVVWVPRRLCPMKILIFMGMPAPRADPFGIQRRRGPTRPRAVRVTVPFRIPEKCPDSIVKKKCTLGKIRTFLMKWRILRIEERHFPRLNHERCVGTGPPPGLRKGPIGHRYCHAHLFPSYPEQFNHRVL